VIPAKLSLIVAHQPVEKLSKMILVTGGAGYVGSHFVRAYAEQDATNRAVVVDNLSRGHRESLDYSKQILFEQASIGDGEKISRILKEHQIEAVVHFAAKAYVGESQDNPFQYFQNNVNESLSFFSVLEAHGVRKIVFSSTCAIYGDPVYLPLDEEHQQKPRNVYGTTKLMIEMALKSLVDSKGWSSVSLRYFNAAGANPDGKLGESHEPETHLIPNILRVAAGKTPVLLINGNDYDTRDGTCLRDYIHVDDLAVAHIKALELLRGQSDGAAHFLNLGTSTGATILEALELCKAVTGRPIASKVGPRRPGDPAALVANSLKAEALLGWRPRYGLKETIETAWNWERQRRY
jgi:UDP-glucose 4-epimerase